jgi:hypothetical protein
MWVKIGLMGRSRWVRLEEIEVGGQTVSNTSGRWWDDRADRCSNRPIGQPREPSGGTRLGDLSASR